MAHENTDADTRPEGADHHGQDGGRETLSAGEAQRDMAGSTEQNVPAMSQNNATDDEKLAGILAQTRADLPGAGEDEVVERLLQRAQQSDISLSEDQARALAAS